MQMNKIRLIFTLFLVLLSFNCLAKVDLFDNLTEFEQFRTYPYIDKALHYEKQKAYKKAYIELEQAINILPQHQAYIQYALNLGKKAQLKPSKLLDLIAKLPTDKRKSYLFEIIKYQLSVPKIYTREQFNNLVVNLDKKEQQQLFFIQFNLLKNSMGEEQAIIWSLKQDDKYKTAITERYAAYYLFSHKRYANSILKLKQLAQIDKLNNIDINYLAKAFSANNEIENGIKYALKVKNNSLLLQIRRENIAKLLRDNKLLLAKEKLEQLKYEAKLTKLEQAQLDFLQSISIVEMQEIAINSTKKDPCLEKLAKYEFNQAIAKFKQCNFKINPYKWLNLAVKYKQYKLLANSKLEQVFWDRKREKILIDYYKVTKDYKSLVIQNNLGHINVEPKDLALANSKLQNFKVAAKLFFELYKKTNKIKYLDLATFNASKFSDTYTVRLIKYGFYRSSDIFIKNNDLVNRVANLSYKDITYFSPIIIEKINNRLKAGVRFSKNSWQEQGQCDFLLKQENYMQDCSLKYRALAACSSDKPHLALKFYKKSYLYKKSAKDELALAILLTNLDKPREANIYWNKLSYKNLENTNKLLYLKTKLQLGQVGVVTSKWANLNLALNYNWWDIGIDLAKYKGDSYLLEERLQAAFDYTNLAKYIYELANIYLANNNIEKLIVLSNRIMLSDKKGNLTAQLAYKLTNKAPVVAIKLFTYVLDNTSFKPTPNFYSQYALAATHNNNLKQAHFLYNEAIDTYYENGVTQPSIKEYLQRSYRDLEYGWKFTLAGWIAQSSGISTPGYTQTTGDYFWYEEAKYYFNNQKIPRSAFYITGIHSGNYKGSEKNNFVSTLDLGFEYQFLDNWNYYLKLGIKQELNNNNDTNPYIRFSADVFSNDNWNLAWQETKSRWLYQNLYLDALYYFDQDFGNSYYARYDIGETFKLGGNNKHRLTPYLFLQWSRNKSAFGKNIDLRAGSGLNWRFEWLTDPYKGKSVITDLAIEWQSILNNQTFADSGNVFMLKFTSYF